MKAFQKRVEILKSYNRQIICMEYMARGRKSLFSTHLPYMKENNIGAKLESYFGQDTDYLSLSSIVCKV